ncbi:MULTISPECIES: hypothetical protein [unclassified Janthinobacterium]|uniref:hypothetical protein n=1 Tax=unclassified Janthinobacterium TaxID=2610881 RepID=UPI001E364C5D|nr:MULTISPECIES: hypothetical protein [unclassified Janthinobacterium]MCC7643317.1 hypothetical protein [Janthinobacterium sp. EB271-G4-3-1]MCC7693798.1 hypothetical protein [Janthinobacterium sp. EB271-G4-3-2]
MRSVHLERDIEDPRSSLAYILTPVARQALDRITEGLQPDSTQRAWRIAGDYGSGKTDFGLALARIAKGEKGELPKNLHRFIGNSSFVPALATGDSEPLGRTVLRALDVPWTAKRKPSTDEVLSAVKAAVVAARKRKFTGVVLVLDELGKNLEFAARHPEEDDIFLLQRLAEEANRSGKNAFLVIAMLHQGVAAYASSLDSVSKREWDKVSGRYEEIVYVQPTEQVATLLSATLNVNETLLPKMIREEASHSMVSAVRAGMYGAAAAESLLGLSARIFPIHPAALPVLTRTMRKFGQNERSLFSFISSGEPMGLQSHIANELNGDCFYRVSDLFDYVRLNLLPTIVSGSSFTHWGVIESVLASTVTEGEIEDKVLKTIAMLSLLDSPDLPSTEAAVALAIGGRSSVVNAAIKSLRQRGVIYERGTVRGLCLWPHTSVDLEEALVRATIATTNGAGGLHALCSHIKSEDLVPRAYYSETGTLRYADVKIVPASDLEKLLTSFPKLNGKGADLSLFVVLPMDAALQKKAQRLLLQRAGEIPEGTYVSVATPQNSAVKALGDLLAWKWIGANVPQLSGDKHAREEVARQIRRAEKHVRDSLEGLDNLAVSNGQRLAWHHCHADSPIILSSGKDLLTFLGKECKRIYSQTPRVLNELINRRYPSSAAVAARTKLVEAMTMNPEKPFLGMDSTKRPPEMALYLSVLEHGNFHMKGENGWVFRVPSEEEDACRLIPTFDLITKTLQQRGNDVLIPLTEVFEILSLPPFGLREGLQPFVVAIYLATHHQRVAVYEDRTYLHEVGGDAFLRLMKEPQHFHLQHCELDTVRTELLTNLLSQLQIDPRDASKADLLDLIRPLAIFIGREVPDYARKTQTLSAVAGAVRRALLDAREPLKLVFVTLPIACGFEPVGAQGLSDPHEFAASLKKALHEIRTAYPNLIERLAASLSAAFRVELPAATARLNIADRAAQLSVAVTEPSLKAFALRLSDKTLEQREWIESIANLLARKSPERWTDKDEAEFNHQLELAAGRFLRTEMALIGTTKKLSGRACRIALTKSDGTEVGELINWDGMDDGRLIQAEAAIVNILSEHGRYGLAAAMRAIWAQLEGEQKGAI